MNTSTRDFTDSIRRALRTPVTTDLLRMLGGVPPEKSAEPAGRLFPEIGHQADELGVSCNPTTADRHRLRREVTSVWIFGRTMERLRVTKARTGQSLYRLADLLINEALDDRERSLTTKEAR